MIDGAMQEFALTLDKFLEHAAKWHPRAQVVTARENGASDRIGYADLRARSLRISAALRDLGVRSVIVWQRSHGTRRRMWRVGTRSLAWERFATHSIRD
jgi:acyl-CoA synthetase (AMP-forming)/AMP-acid ligase II